MSAPIKRVTRFTSWVDAAFDEGVRRETDIDLRVLAVPASAEAAWAALADTHVFHVSAAKDELPKYCHVGEALLSHCPQLLCASSYGAGYDPIDVPACTRAGVAVVNQAGGNAVSVAELALGLILSVARRITESDRRLRTDRGFTREDLTGRELAGKTLGVVGIGHTGRRVAALGAAFGMTVLATDPFVPADEIARRGARAVGLNELLAQSDVVSLHCPRDASTMKMIDASAYARMKRGAIFVSTARGGIHDERALADALASGHLSGAGLDVWDQEPPPLDHPLLQCPTVVATYHTAGVTTEARRNMAVISAEQIVSLLAGKRPPRLVNPEVWPAYAARFAKILGRPVAI
ncbi:MAG TPA: hydroxyacid dehydrogenase [Burkholderiaceae bacterium]|nr:hydroxyacid dehydrogenase [Burkholderiaceae bacterium]